jgi:hypothetical protein
MTEQPFRIFINYRRSDTAGPAHHISDRLKSIYGDDAVFMDIAGIELGVDFTEALRNAVGDCDLFLCLIGKDWTQATDSDGARRLDDPRDFVRFEIAAALARGDVRVLPLLLDDASMLQAEELPEELAPLAVRNALEVPQKYFDYALARLTDLIDRLRIAKLEPSASGPTTSEDGGEVGRTPPPPAEGLSTELSVSSQLRSIGAAPILVEAAELGLITEFGCGMPECMCPIELGGRTYFDSDGHWRGIVALHPKRKEDGGQRTLGNVQLAHNLCARVDYSKSAGRPYAKDLANVEAARLAALTADDQTDLAAIKATAGASVTEQDPVPPAHDLAGGVSVAEELQRMGAHNILVQAAEQGYLTEFGCGMPECLCPEELGGRRYFDSETPDHWHGIVGHRYVDKEDGGHRTVDNVVLSHKLCDRVNYSKKIGRSDAKDRASAEAARQAALNRK